jgi:hypothetical protein
VLVNPRPGVDRRHLREALRRVQTEVRNVRDGDVDDRPSAYIRWAHNSVKVLAKQISAADLDRLILTRRYWVLQSLSVRTESFDNLIDLELDERVADLEDACNAFERQINLWASLDEFVVADTSFYIQHPNKLEEVDLAGLLNVPEKSVHLLVPIIVVDELDGLKQSKDRHVRWRAGYTLAVFDRLFSRFTDRPAQLRAPDASVQATSGRRQGEVTVELVFDPPGHVRLPINDDEIVDRVLNIWPVAARDITLLTFDTSQSLRARAVGLRVLKIPHDDDGDEPT